MEIMFSAFATVVSLLSFAWSLLVHHRSLVRERRQDTLDAFNVLQSQVLDELRQYDKGDIEKISKNNHDPRYKELSSLLARCEHFSVGVNQKIYDLETVRRLGGEHIVRIYTDFLPLINTKRKYKNNLERYREFETLAIKLGYEAQSEDKSDGKE